MKQLLGMVLACVGVFGGGAGQAAEPAAPVAPVVRGTVHEALFSIAFDGAVGVAVGAAGAILDTGDGGKTWKAVEPAPTALSLLGIAVQPTRQIAVGQMGLILTREGSGAWQPAETGTQERLFAVALNSKGRAAAVGGFGTVLKSDDGGRTWASVAPEWGVYAEEGMQPHIYDVDVDENGAITVVGEFGLIARSSDGGVTWKPLHRGDASLFALQMNPTGASYAVGQDGTLLRSTDGGAKWAVVDLQTKAILLGVHASADGQIVVTGVRDMVISRDGGASWKHISTPEINASWYAGVARSGQDRAALVVGHSGQIIRVGG